MVFCVLMATDTSYYLNKFAVFCFPSLWKLISLIYVKCLALFFSCSLLRLSCFGVDLVLHLCRIFVQIASMRVKRYLFARAMDLTAGPFFLPLFSWNGILQPLCSITRNEVLLRLQKNIRFTSKFTYLTLVICDIYYVSYNINKLIYKDRMLHLFPKFISISN